MQYREDRQGDPISLLGFGCMRFTRKGNSIDLEKAERELMTAIKGGVNYLDTAYIYPGSEAAVGEILKRNHCRSQVKIATKLPQYYIKTRGAIDRYFDEQLKRLQTDYVDYYLMHMLTDVAAWEKLKELGIEEWIEKKKQEGKIGSIGFSFHGNTEMFLQILDAYDWDFCQIQYNYMDENTQAGREGLHAAAKKGLPVIIMEPLRGGKLVNLLPEKAKKLIAENRKGYTAGGYLCPFRHELCGYGEGKYADCIGGTGRRIRGGRVCSDPPDQTGDPEDSEGRMHRLRVLYALSERN